MSWSQGVVLVAFWLTVAAMVCIAQRGRQPSRPTESPAATTYSYHFRGETPPDEALSEEESIRRIAQDPRLQAKTAELIARARRARDLEDIGPIVDPEPPPCVQDDTRQRSSTAR